MNRSSAPAPAKRRRRPRERPRLVLAIIDAARNPKHHALLMCVCGAGLRVSEVVALGGPAQVFDYLGRYTHRVAINNHRIEYVGEGKVVFRAKNRKKKKTTRVPLDAFEFIRRFCLHILPPRFMKIRAYGFLANANKKAALAAIRKSLGTEPPPEPSEEDREETTAEKIQRLTGLDITRYPKCGDTLVPEPLPLPERPP